MLGHDQNTPRSFWHGSKLNPIFVKDLGRIRRCRPSVDAMAIAENAGGWDTALNEPLCHNGCLIMPGFPYSSAHNDAGKIILSVEIEGPLEPCPKSGGRLTVLENLIAKNNTRIGFAQFIVHAIGQNGNHGDSVGQGNGSASQSNTLDDFLGWHGVCFHLSFG